MSSAPVAVVYLPELMDPFCIDLGLPFDDQVPEPYRARVREVMASAVPAEEVA